MTVTPDGSITNVVSGADPRFQMNAPITRSMSVELPSGLRSTMTGTRTATLADPLNTLSLVTQLDSTVLNGRVFTSTYDASARTVANVTPEGRRSETVLDEKGRVIEERIAGIVPTTYAYDARGRVQSVSQGGRTVSYGYGADGRVDRVTDPLGLSSSFTYDSVGRLRSKGLPDGRVIGFTYDRNGNLESLTPPGRSAHAFAYTAADQAERYGPPVLPDGSETPTRWTYDLDGAVDTIVRPGGSRLTFGYDGAGRPISLTTPEGQLGIVYHAQTGNVSSMTAPGASSTLAFTYDGMLPTRTAWTGAVNGSLELTYDSDFRPKTVSVNGTNAVSYLYDRDGLLTRAGQLALRRRVDNGLLDSAIVGGVASGWRYDSLGYVNTYAARYGATNLLGVVYGRDSLGRITSLTETIQGTTRAFTYAYDSAGRLTDVYLGGALVESYGYDANGNRQQLTTPAGVVTGSYDGQDRLLTYGDAAYGYAATGELATKVVGTDTTSYAYDALGNLRAVRLPAGTLVEYVADAQNRRIGRKADGALIQGFLYHGQLAPVAELGGAGEVVSRFVYAARANVPEYMVKAGVTYRLVTDHLGSVRLVVNVATGEVTQRLDYDASGRVMINTSPGFQPFGYAGGLMDDATGLVRFGARDYDAETGRWTAKEPLGFAGGDANLYAYVRGDPVNMVDPDGQLPIVALAAAAWGAAELGLSLADLAAFLGVLTDPCASGLDKLTSSGYLAAGMIAPGGGYGSIARKGFSKEKEALVEMARKDKRSGATRADMRAYEELNSTLPDPFPVSRVRTDEGHPSRSLHSQQPHGHVGPVRHIPIVERKP